PPNCANISLITLDPIVPPKAENIIIKPAMALCKFSGWLLRTLEHSVGYILAIKKPIIGKSKAISTPITVSVPSGLISVDS
ncbi:hypothetical protein, partial [Bradyrhizobium ivorense]|uniref:hypothetical protein n=1 Tax=Bradyrhizobium ivorense TaxID=2511166 RepID=UPI00155A6D6E